MVSLIDKLRRLLGAETPNTVAALEAALAEIDIEALREKQSRIGAERQGLLLTGTDAQILDAEDRLNVARLDVERALLAKDELTTRLNAAREAETNDAFFAANAAAVEAVAAWAVKARREIDKAGKALTAVVDEGRELSEKVRAVSAQHRPHIGTGNAIDLATLATMPYGAIRDHSQYERHTLIDALHSHVLTNLPAV